MLVNLLSASASYLTLVHHYSLPLAVVAVVACIDGLRRHPAGLFLDAVLGGGLLAGAGQALVLTGPTWPAAPAESRWRSPSTDPTTSCRAHHQLFAPRFSQRISVGFPKSKQNNAAWNVLLLNPSDPGWDSSQTIQKRLLAQVKARSWTCRSWHSGLVLCREPAASNHK